LGKWDTGAPALGREHVTIAVSGAYGGATVDFRKFAARGMILVGMTKHYKDGILHFADDLARNIESGDANYLSVLEEADAFATRNGMALPEEPDAKIIAPAPECMINPIRSLHLTEMGISTIIWATGFAFDYDWLKVDTLDAQGKPIHTRGISKEPGLYFLGLPWQSRRGSSFIWGVWHDARFIADQIGIQRNYLAYSAAQ
jgi:putative flavoprotein involved in K+ transport